MKQAPAGGDPVAAEFVAAECLVAAETKDHQNWELLCSRCNRQPVFYALAMSCS